MRYYPIGMLVINLSLKVKKLLIHYYLFHYYSFFHFLITHLFFVINSLFLIHSKAYKLKQTVHKSPFVASVHIIACSWPKDIRAFSIRKIPKSRNPHDTLIRLSCCNIHTNNNDDCFLRLVTFELLIILYIPFLHYMIDHFLPNRWLNPPGWFSWIPPCPFCVPVNCPPRKQFLLSHPINLCAL